jgi:tRNA(Ile)-lysidine synthase
VAGGPAFKLAERVAKTASRFAMLEGDEQVVVAVSGGPDSICLLHVLGRLRADLTLVVAHVDHGLSEASEELGARIARDAAVAGFDVHVAKASGLEGPNLHARARDFRYSFFEAIAQQEGATKIATGHTLDDRVETTLARFIHGAGTDALVGIPPVEGLRVRPLIELRRAEARSYCDEAGLTYFDDPANEDARFDRPVIRTAVLGAIEERWGDGSIRAMASSIERLREDSAALGELAERIYPGIVSSPDGEDKDRRLLDLQAVLALSRALRRRVLERSVGRARDRSGGIEAVLDALEKPDRKAGARFDVADGTSITIESTHIAVFSEPPH